MAGNTREADVTCPLKRCDGTLEVWASGINAQGVPVEMSLCDRCGKVVETEVAPDDRQGSLFGGDG